jgi:hypothetical protein
VASVISTSVLTWASGRFSRRTPQAPSEPTPKHPAPAGV